MLQIAGRDVSLVQLKFFFVSYLLPVFGPSVKGFGIDITIYNGGLFRLKIIIYLIAGKIRILLSNLYITFSYSIAAVQMHRNLLACQNNIFICYGNIACAYNLFFILKIFNLV